MPGGFPFALQVCNAVNYGTATTGGEPGTSVFTGGSANTKGSWTQITAATTADACLLIVQFAPFDDPPFAVDIGVGASGSEVTIASNLVLNSTTNSTEYMIPCQIPAGARIAARAQAPGVSFEMTLSVIAFDGSFSMYEGYAGIDSIGFNTATTTGTVLTASNTPYTKGSYVQLTASTSRDYAGLIVGYDSGTTVTDFNYFLIDIAIGASGSEIVILPNLIWNYNASTITGDPPNSPFIPISVPSGTRLSARATTTFGNVGTTAVAVGVTLYGIYQ